METIRCKECRHNPEIVPSDNYRGCQYAQFTGRSDDTFCSAYDRKEKMVTKKYRIGWCDSHTGIWKYVTVSSKEEAIAEFADKLCLSDKVSCKATRKLNLREEKDV